MPEVEENKLETIEKELQWDSRVRAAGIKVEVQDSKAILSGTANSYHEKKYAEECVCDVPGINSVENKIKVSYPKESLSLSDTEIKSSLDRMLEWDARIDSADVTVAVESGVIRLTGNVDAIWKKEIAEERANSISGVVDVDNKIKVKTKTSFSDGEIAEEVKNAMKRSKIVNAEDISVEVNDGVAVLRGKVANQRVKRAAADKAAITDGVVDIVNQIETTS